MILGVSGHRELIKPTEEIYEQFLYEVDWMKPKAILSGLAVGFDSIVAQAAIDLNIPLWAAIPFPDQHKLWSPEQKKKYEFFLSKAQNVYVANNTFSNWAYHKRNRHIVDTSHNLIVWLTEVKGGTFKTVEYANQKNKCVINLAEKLLKGVKEV